MGNELIGKRIKIVWLDSGNSKVVIGELINFENGLFQVKAYSGQIFYINQANLVSLCEYRGDWK